MKNLKSFYSIFLIFSIVLANVGVFPLSVFASEKSDFYLKKNEDDSLSRIKEESYSMTGEFLLREIADKQLGARESGDKTKSLESSKRAEREGKNYVEGEILVKYKKNKINLETYSGRLIAENFSRSKSLEKKEDLIKANISVLKIKDSKTVEEKIAELINDQNVEYAQPNFQYYPLSIDTNDTYKEKLWGLDNAGQSVNGVSGTNDADIDAPEAWAINEGTNTSTIVVVIDDGVAYNHPDLVNNMWDGANCKDENGNSLGGCNHGYDYEDNDKTPLPTSGSHGTYIAGTIAAVKNNDKGIIGVAPNAKIMAIKTNLTTGQIIKGIEFAGLNGAKIINASWAGTSFDQAMYEAINNFSGLFIAAAGNGENYGDPNIGDDHDGQIHLYPSDYDLDNIVSVAATDQDDNLASFSDYGLNSVDVGAPGVNIYSIIAESVVFSEDFEGGTYKVGTGGVTQSYWGIGSDGSSNVAYSDFYNYPYEFNAYTWLMQKDALDLSVSNISGASISFVIWCDTPSSATFDDYILTTYYSNGVWYNSTKYDEDKIRIDGGNAWIDNGHMGYYKKYTENISSYLTNDFKFSFDWITDDSVDYNWGCTIDDINIIKYSDGLDEKYDFGDGTSMAAPYVAGLAGLIWGYKPDLTYSQVKDIILNTGDDKPSLSGKTVTGKRINAFNALSAIDVEAPTLSEITPVPTPTNDNTPDYTFNSDEAGMISYDGGCDSTTTDAIIGDNTITFNTLIDGIYDSCTVTVTDGEGNSSALLNVSEFIIDTTAPVITLIGETPVNLTVGDSYTDQGVTALDDVDGDITGSIVVGGDTIDTSTPGTYVITYNVSDTAGNPATEVTRTVIVSEAPIPPDTTPPVITLIGEATINLTVGDSYTDAGATALDDVDGDITTKIVVVNPVNTNATGTYIITYNVSDAAGNPADGVTRTIIVSEAPDTIPPIITAPADQTFEATGVSTTPILVEATATDNVDPNPFITYDPHSFSVGTTSVTWTATDASGNKATATSNVIITDTTAPVITGTPTDITEEVDSGESGAIVSYTVPTATDLVDGLVAVTCTPASGSTFPLGDTAVTCTATDAAGNTATSTFKVTVVVDSTPPIITLLGDNPITIEVGTTYNDAGATASDNHDGNITGNMVIVNPVNSNTIGIYTVTYNVTDSSGNPATEVTRTVNVVDTTPPVITLLGENPITIPVNTVYDDVGATASDNYDGVITNNIVTVNSVDTNTIGTYYVTYNVIDSSSNPAIEIIRTVNVVDVLTPIISLLGNNPLTIEVGSVYSDAGATATDDVDGDISGNIIVVNNVNSNILGTYTVTYNVSDSSGNHAPEAIRTVNVVDTTAPVIVLLGDNPASVEVGYEYNDAGATANDNYDGDITDSIVTVNPVDYNTVGTYTVTYNVTDSSGNPADEVTRTVIVSVDTTPPTISGLSNDTVPKKSKTWNWDSTDSTAKFRYVIDQSATSTVTGDYTDIKTATQSSGDGVYYLHVQAKDDAGNESTIVTVSAILDNTPPVVVLSGLPTDSTTETTANITVGGQDVVYYKYKLDSGNYSDEIATTTPITLSGLSTGLHVVYVMGRDTAGNWQTEENKTSYSWTINPISTGGGGGGGGGGGATTPPSYKTGDINKDNKVDKYDFSMMMAAWGKTGSNTSDLNGDNKVDKYDFALLMSKWSTM